jgi:hypothetical protein
MRSLAHCFPNVLVNDREFQMDSQGHNQLASLLECAQQLAANGRHWNYFIFAQVDRMGKCMNELNRLESPYNGLQNTIEISYDGLKG